MSPPPAETASVVAYPRVAPPPRTAASIATTTMTRRIAPPRPDVLRESITKKRTLFQGGWRAAAVASSGQQRLVERAPERPPVAGEPVGDPASEGVVGGCLGLAPPRQHSGVMDAVARRIHVDAADHVVVRIENGEREAFPVDEVSGVTLQVSAVLVQAHLPRPFPIGEARRAPNVFHARRPGCVVTLVVFRAERLQAKVPGRERGRRVKIGWYERASRSHVSSFATGTTSRTVQARSRAVNRTY